MPAKSALADAINYTLGHWDGLTVFLGDGRVELDSNTVERTIRPIALGPRNALFAGSSRGAEAWAILASIINTAKLHEIDPETYLADVLERIQGQISCGQARGTEATGDSRDHSEGGRTSHGQAARQASANDTSGQPHWSAAGAEGEQGRVAGARRKARASQRDAPEQEQGAQARREGGG